VLRKFGKVLGIRKLAILSAVLVMVILGSYAVQSYFSASVQNSVYAASDQKASSADQTLVTANTGFAFNLFRELTAEGSDGNVFISPLSISMALAMTYNGAGGTTKDAMSNVLNFGGMSLEEVDQGFSNLMDSLRNADQAVSLLIANSVWMRQEFEPLVYQSFLDRVRSSFDGEAFTRDFANPQTVNEINGWIDSATNGKIKNMINQVDPELVMFLINAIYFKGSWVTKFDQSQTKPQVFYVAPGNTTKVDMMYTSGKFSYYTDGNRQIARLPYGRDKIAMYIFLPNEGVSLDSFVASLNQTVHDEYISRLAPVNNLIVELPKFKVEYGVKRLNGELEKLGMGVAFDKDAANFSNIAPLTAGNLYISFVDHKAVVEVNEEGTEAAGATVVGIFQATTIHEIPPSFIVNRPFYFEIRDDRSGSILFMGKILNPTD
jgi:serine protease inhibitor